MFDVLSKYHTQSERCLSQFDSVNWSEFYEGKKKIKKNKIRWIRYRFNAFGDKMVDFMLDYSQKHSTNACVLLLSTIPNTSKCGD